MNTTLNISTYKFVPLPDAPALREQIHSLAQGLGLKGTVLLAHEGINLFVAGAPQQVRSFVAALRSDARLSDLMPKESWSDAQPFKRLRVKLKREIIRMNQPQVLPDFSAAAGRAPVVDAPTLKRWLDQGHDDAGRPVVTLDTRNAFEVDCGSFEQAIDWRLSKFSDFPQALREHQAQLQGKTVVSFCTGGIRCEKAAIYMQQSGLGQVYQLDGGILKYFEQVGGAHFRGHCFVFDERVALDPALSATASVHSAAVQA